MKVIQPSFTWHGEAPNGVAMLRSIAAAGRVCYQSEANGKSDADFVRSVIARGHESVIEHEKLSVQIICDRGVTHEVVRHRIASYSQESTRYCNYSKDKFDNEITFIDLTAGVMLCPVTSKLDPVTIHRILDEWWAACEDAERHYMHMIELGASPQIARSVLNNSTKTAIIVTMDLREWRHFFKLREAPAAHPQMREIAIPMLKMFREAVPVIFDDLEVHS